MVFVPSTVFDAQGLILQLARLTILETACKWFLLQFVLEYDFVLLYSC